MCVNISVLIDKTERAKAFAFGFLEVIIVAKHDIVQIVSAKAGVDIVDTEKVIDSFLEYIVTEIAAGRSVVLAGFGAFRYRETAPRRGIKPATGEYMEIPSGARVSFKAGSPFTRAVRESYAMRNSGGAGRTEATERLMQEVLSVPGKKGRSSTKIVINLPKELRQFKPDWQVKLEESEKEKTEK